MYNSVDMLDELYEAANDYRMSKETKSVVESTPFHMLSSISGGGKGVIADSLVDTGRYEFFVTHTTRERITDEGNQEKDGEDYYFVDDEAMFDLIKRGVFIETNIIHEESVYGASVQELKRIRESGALPLHTPDISGAQKILDISNSAVAVFIVPPSADTWIERLLARGPIPMDKLENRINSAHMDIGAVLNDERIICVINDNLDEAVERVDEIFHENQEKEFNDDEARKTLKKLQEEIQDEELLKRNKQRN